MLEALVFNGIQSLDFYEVRANVVRIPEVSSRIFEVQEIWDNVEGSNFNFYNFLVSEDQVFQGNIKLKSLATAIVQIGLFDRYIRHFKRPEYIIGCSNGDAPLKVALGILSLEDLVFNSSARQLTRPSSILQLAETPILSGISLSEYASYKLDTEKNEFVPVVEGNKNFNNVIRHAIDKEGVKKFVNIGPGSLLLNRTNDEFSMADIQILESIDLDPMLNWFWREVQNAQPLQMMA